MCLRCVCVCCKLRTAILFVPFLLGSFEFTLFCLFMTYINQFRAYFNYTLEASEDLKAAGGIVGVDLIANVCLVCAVNKDYSGRNLDLKRWWISIVWLFVYGTHTIGLLGAGIVALFQLVGLNKLFGLLPLAYGSSLFVFYILVSAFLLDQKHKLSGVAQRPLPSISRVISIERF